MRAGRLARVDDDGPTEAFVIGAFDERTTAGAPGTLALQHLSAVRDVLEPLHGAYVAAAVEQLHALPPDARRSVLPHVVAEHPAIRHDARVVAMAAELGVALHAEPALPLSDGAAPWLFALTGVRAADDADALARIERALETLSVALSRVAAHRLSLRRALALDAETDAELPTDPVALLVWALGAAPNELARRVAVLASDLEALGAATRDAAVLSSAALAPVAIEARAPAPAWWPRPFRDAALWTAFVDAYRASTPIELAIASAYHARRTAPRGPSCVR